MVFNSCGKLVGKCWNFHKFSKFCAVYVAHGVFYSCGKAKSGRSGKREQGFRFFRLSSTFPQEFSTHSQKEILKKAKIGRRPTKKRWSGGKEIKKRNFSRIFSTLQKEELWAKSCHISRFGGFSTVSAGSTNITNNSLYYSFVIALRAKKRERIKKGIISMKIVFNRQNVNDSVAPLMCAVSGKSTLTAAEGILIEANADGSCVMTTFDLEKGMRIKLEAEVEEAGAAIINAQKFVQTIRVMEGETVTLTVNENLQACISSGKSNHKMTALHAQDYPTIPRLVTEDGFVVGQALLKKMLSKVMFAMASNDQRPVLNGCYFKVSNDELLMVSCDSYKLARCATKANIENKNEDGSELKFSFIIPTKTVNELFKLLKDDEREDVRIYMSRKNIVFNIGDMVFFSRLIEGQYIDYDRIILKTHRIFATVDRERMIAALERAALVTEEKIAGSVRSHVKLAFENNLLMIFAVSTLGSTYDEIEIEQEGERIIIAFNNRFLLDSLRASDAEKVRISMTSALTSINIEPAEQEEDCTDLFMLLPVRMKE